MPSRRHNSAMLDSPRKPSSTMRIFSSDECRLRVARRMFFTIRSAELAALVAAEGRFPMKAVADALEVARSHLHEKVRRLAKPRGSYRKPDDGDLLPLIRRLVDERPTYGYRRITALANRELVKTGKPMANHKRIFRIMRQNGMLLARHTGRRKDRPHDGKVVVMRSNL